MGKWEDGKMGKWGDGELGSWKEGDLGRVGFGEMKLKTQTIQPGEAGSAQLNLKPKPLKHKTMNLISRIMMYVSQIIGLVATVRGFNEMRKMRSNPELKKASELMKQQEMQVNQTAVHD